MNSPYGYPIAPGYAPQTAVQPGTQPGTQTPGPWAYPPTWATYVAAPPQAIPAPLPAPQAPAAQPLLNANLVKGLAFGAVAAYLLTNEAVQQKAITGAVRIWSMMQGGVEEMKERFRDAEAELHAHQAHEED